MKLIPLVGLVLVMTMGEIGLQSAHWLDDAKRSQHSVNSGDSTDPNSKAIAIACFGDSVSGGYPDRLDSFLSHQTINPSIRVVNRYKTFLGRAGLQAEIDKTMRDAHPDIVVVMLGKNRLPTIDLDTAVVPPRFGSIFLLRALAVRLDEIGLKLRSYSLWTEYLFSRSQADRDLSATLELLRTAHCCRDLSLPAVSVIKLKLEALRYFVTDEAAYWNARFLLATLIGDESIMPELKKQRPGDDELPLYFGLQDQRRLTSLGGLEALLSFDRLSELGCMILANSLAAEKVGLRPTEAARSIGRKCSEKYPHSFHLAYLHFINSLHAGDLAEAGLILDRIESMPATDEVIANRSSVRLDYARALLSKEPKYKKKNDDSTALLLIRKALQESRRAIAAGPRNPNANRSYSAARKMLLDRSIDPGLDTVDETTVTLPKASRDFEPRRRKSTEDPSFQLPQSLIRSLQSVCTQSKTSLWVMQYPTQDLAPLRIALSAVPCAEFLDSRKAYKDVIRGESVKMAELFQADGFHLTEKGDRVLVHLLCEKIRSSFATLRETIRCNETK